MHKSRLGQVNIDCQTDDLDRAADFWARALGVSVKKLSDPIDANYRGLTMPADQVKIEVQKVDHPSRVHLDIEADDVEAEVRRLERLGAKRIAQVRTWWIMEAPTGQRFCVVRVQRSDFAENANVWSD
jgi:predicted enzyme related to lactoylglutathione lyase